ncbi:MAG: hypothetical protein BJ554DRAFT_897, partial [Olpidium bornovanus]
EQTVPARCDEELSKVTVLVQELTEQAEEAIQKCQAVLDLGDSPQGHTLVSDAYLETARQVLTFRRQLVLYLDAMQEQLFVSRGTLKNLAEKFDATLRELKQTCRSKSAVPVDHVYPHFMVLAQMWATWQDELFLLLFRRGIADTLLYFTSNVQLTFSDLVSEAAKPFEKEVEPANDDGGPRSHAPFFLFCCMNHMIFLARFVPTKRQLAATSKFIRGIDNQSRRRAGCRYKRHESEGGGRSSREHDDVLQTSS